MFSEWGESQWKRNPGKPVYVEEPEMFLNTVRSYRGKVCTCVYAITKQVNMHFDLNKIMLGLLVVYLLKSSNLFQSLIYLHFKTHWRKLYLVLEAFKSRTCFLVVPLLHGKQGHCAVLFICNISIFIYYSFLFNHNSQRWGHNSVMYCSSFVFKKNKWINKFKKKLYI